MTKMTNLQWQRATRFEPKHCIISSDAVLRGDKVFVPSYLNDPEDLRLIIANIYPKKWISERDEYRKELSKAINEGKVDPKCKRRFVINNKAYVTKGERKLPYVKLKEFQHLFQKPPPKEKKAPPRYFEDCKTKTKTKDGKLVQKDNRRYQQSNRPTGQTQQIDENCPYEIDMIINYGTNEEEPPEVYEEPEQRKPTCPCTCRNPEQQSEEPLSSKAATKRGCCFIVDL